MTTQPDLFAREVERIAAALRTEFERRIRFLPGRDEIKATGEITSYVETTYPRVMDAFDRALHAAGLRVPDSRGADLRAVDPEAEQLLHDIASAVSSNRSWAKFYSRIMDLLTRLAAPSQPVPTPYRCGGPQSGQPKPHTACNCTPREPAQPAPPPEPLDGFIATTFTALRRRLVGTPPNVDSIDAAIGDALNGCEATILRALDEGSTPDPSPEEA